MYADAKAAGAMHALVLAVVMTAIALLFFMGAVGLKCSTLTRAQQHVSDDLSHIFKPISLFIIVFLIVDGLLSETSSDWGNLVVFASMCSLGLAFGMSGVIKDMISYIFIR